MARKRQKDKLTKDYFMTYWRERLTQTVLSIFKWDGLPEEINKDALEKSILLGGYAIFFKDRQLDNYFALGGALTGVNVYGYPTHARPISLAPMVTFDEMDMNECVIIYANKTRTTAINHIEEFADKLSELDLAIKLNIMALKHPVVVHGTQETKQSFDALLHQYEETYYQIITDDKLQIDKDVSAINFGVSSSEVLDLQKQKETVLNEFYAMFGVSGSVEKRERIISGEINSMMEQFTINKHTWMDTRMEACNKINKMFGLNVSIGYNQDYDLSDGKDNGVEEEVADNE